MGSQTPPTASPLPGAWTGGGFERRRRGCGLQIPYARSGCRAWQGTLGLRPQFSHVGIEPSRPFANGVSGGLGSPVLWVTRRAQSAYLRPSDLSCCFLPVAEPGGARARLYPRLLEGGAGEARGGAREGRDRGPRFRGDRGSAASRGARTRTGTTPALRRQVSKNRVPGFVSHFPQLFVWPRPPERPRGGREPGSPFPPPSSRPECGRWRSRDPGVPGPGPEQLPAPWDLRTVSPSFGLPRVPRVTHALQSLGVSEACLHLSARLRLPPLRVARGLKGDLSGVGAGAPALAWGGVVTSPAWGWGKDSTFRDKGGMGLASCQEASVVVPRSAQRWARSRGSASVLVEPPALGGGVTPAGSFLGCRCLLSMKSRL